MFESAKILFAEDGVYITTDDKKRIEFLRFDRNYFQHYSVREEPLWLLKSDMIGLSKWFLKRSYWGDVFQFTLNADRFILMTERGVTFQRRNLFVGDSPFPRTFARLDDIRLPYDFRTRVNVRFGQFRGLSDADFVNIEVNDGILRISGVDKREWNFHKDISDIEVEPQSNVSTKVDGMAFKKITSLRLSPSLPGTWTILGFSNDEKYPIVAVNYHGCLNRWYATYALR